MAANNTSKQTVFTKNLQMYLELNNTTQVDVARAVGVTASTFCDWMKGRSAPRLDKMQKLAQYFGVELSDLIEPHDNENQSHRQKEIAALVEELLDKPELLSFFLTVQKLSEEDREILASFAQRLLGKEEK